MFIELTRTGGEKILVNISNFDIVSLSRNGETVLEKLGQECYECIKETSEEIMQKIKEIQHV